MFGEDLEEFIKENINFKNQGNRANQDIYYSISNRKFWIHTYFGNESLSPDSIDENIFIIGVDNTEEFGLDCSYCERECDGYCSIFDECQAESLYENIKEHMYAEWGVASQIDDKLLADVHYSELAEIDLLLEEQYGDYHRFLDKTFNSNRAMEFKDNVIDNILENGLADEIDDSYLDGDCQHLVVRYCDDTDNPLLVKLGDLLSENKIVEALELIKN